MIIDTNLIPIQPWFFKKDEMSENINEHDLQITQKIFQNSIECLLKQKNIQRLLIEVYLMTDELAPQIIDSILTEGISDCNLRNFQKFATDRAGSFDMVWKSSVNRCP